MLYFRDLLKNAEEYFTEFIFPYGVNHTMYMITLHVPNARQMISSHK